MNSNHDVMTALQSFIHDGLVENVLYEVRSGKEATVFCCRSAAGAKLPPLVAAKVYKPADERSFKRDDVYLAGRVERSGNSRIHRALKKNSSFGQNIASRLWIYHEWTQLTRLAAAHLPVPEPIACGEQAILMSYFGDEETPAPTLSQVTLEKVQVEPAVDAILEMIEILLDEHCVHGDLSPYNLIWWQQQPILIDLPQAVDPRLNPAGHMLLVRDVANVCDWAARNGVHRDAGAIAHDLWTRFTLGEIG